MGLITGRGKSLKAKPLLGNVKSVESSGIPDYSHDVSLQAVPSDLFLSAQKILSIQLFKPTRYRFELTKKDESIDAAGTSYLAWHTMEAEGLLLSVQLYARHAESTVAGEWVEIEFKIDNSGTDERFVRLIHVGAAFSSMQVNDNPINIYLKKGDAFNLITRSNNTAARRVIYGVNVNFVYFRDI